MAIRAVSKVRGTRGDGNYERVFVGGLEEVNLSSCCSRLAFLRRRLFKKKWPRSSDSDHVDVTVSLNLIRSDSSNLRKLRRGQPKEKPT